MFFSVCLQTISLNRNRSTKVYNDIALNIDTGKVTTLTHLDLSAVFKTIDYSVLLDRLSDSNGIWGISFTWICSFLINRFQLIQIRKYFTNAVSLFCGVPQGSALGPLLFTLYTTTLSSLIHSDKFIHADETQLYMSLSTADTDFSLKQYIYISSL